MFSEIVSQIRTSEDKYLSLREIDMLLSSMYKMGGKSFEPTLEKHVRGEFANLLRNEAKKEGANLEKFLKDLQSQIISMKEIILEIAFEPSSESVWRIYDYLAKSIGQEFVISFLINDDIVAGAVISFQGKFHNGSVKEEAINFINKQNEK